MLYDDFKPIVDLVLNNWTALQLAVEHGMGAPGGEKTAQLMSVYVARYCVENMVCVDDLTELLEDLMDEEFDTVCHDNSPKEVSIMLINFLAMLKEGRQDELRAQIEAIPPSQRWLSQPLYSPGPPQSHGNPDDDTTSSDDDSPPAVARPLDTVIVHDQNLLIGPSENTNSQSNSPNDLAEASSSFSEPMDEDEPEDPTWTVVRSRKNK